MRARKTASNSASFVGKWRKSVPTPTPAAFATSSVAAAVPRSANTFSAASRSRSRFLRASARMGNFLSASTR